MSLNFVTSAIPGLISISHAIVLFQKFSFLVEVCAFHFKQLLACPSERLISIAIYERIAQRIEREKRKCKRMGQNYYVYNVTTSFKKDIQK